MNTTSIYSWYKKVTNLVSKNIDKLNTSEYTVEVSFMGSVKEKYRCIKMTVFRHIDDNCEIIHRLSICNYLEEKENKKSFKDFKNFLENIETLI